MSARVVVIYGPQGCGKSARAEQFRRYYGASRVYEFETFRRCKKPRLGDLVLAHEDRGLLQKLIGDGTFPKDCHLVSFADAVKAARAQRPDAEVQL